MKMDTSNYFFYGQIGCYEVSFPLNIIFVNLEGIFFNLFQFDRIFHYVEIGNIYSMTLITCHCLLTMIYTFTTSAV